MATVDRVLQMQNQGIQESQIIDTLRSEGLSSKEISDSLAQAKIKSAVNQPSVDNMPQQNYSQQTNQGDYQESYTPQGNYQEEYSQPQQNYQEQQYSPEQYQQPQQNYSQQQYADQGYSQQYADQGYYPETSMSVDTMSEIAERVLIQKMKEINQKMKSSEDFKQKADEDIKEIKNRLKRIEDTIDNIHKAVLTKVGEFGQTTSLVHKDLDNLHGTVSKLMNPLIDNYNELKKVNEKHHHTTHTATHHTTHHSPEHHTTHKKTTKHHKK